MNRYHYLITLSVLITYSQQYQQQEDEPNTAQSDRIMLDKKRFMVLVLILGLFAIQLSYGLHMYNIGNLPQECARLEKPQNIPSLSFPPQFLKGSIAPQFDVTDTDGNTVSLFDLQGKVVVLHFMATSCQSCIWEMESLIDLFRYYGEKNVVFLSINTSPTGTVEDTNKFRSDYCSEWTYILDDGSLFAKYEIQILPSTIVIDQTGKIVYEKIGMLDTPRIGEDEIYHVLARLT